jgi:hypothetical protein
MIKPEDADYHVKPDTHWQWAETYFFPVQVPGTTINGGIYVLARPVLGVAMASVTFMDRISDLWEEQAYIDNQQHLPCPKSLLDIDLPNGLSIKCIEPLKHYRVTYQGIDDTRCELDYVALHAPFDLNDPAMDPIAAQRNGATSWDNAFAGHYEVTYRITGELVLRGTRHLIDAVDTGDRSWGPRGERDNACFIWWHASFGEELTAHVLTGHDFPTSNKVGALISGYVLENGQTYGITDCQGQQDYRKGLPLGGHLEVTDIRDKTFAFTYSALNACYMAPYPSNTYLQTFMRVNHNGRIGTGVQQFGLSRAYATRHRAAILAKY